jgi:hypothetical protein
MENEDISLEETQDWLNRLLPKNRDITESQIETLVEKELTKPQKQLKSQTTRCKCSHDISLHSGPHNKCNRKQCTLRCKGFTLPGQDWPRLYPIIEDNRTRQLIIDWIRGVPHNLTKEFLQTGEFSTLPDQYKKLLRRRY